MSQIFPNPSTGGCPIEVQQCWEARRLDELPTVDVDIEAPVVQLGTARPGALKSWDLTNSVSFPDATQGDLKVDLIASTDPGPVQFDQGTGPQTFIEIPVSPVIGVSSHTFRFSYDVPGSGNIYRWRIFFPDIDGDPNAAVPGGGQERVCFSKSIVDCWAVLSPEQGGALTVDETATEICVTGMDDNDQINLGHTLAILSSSAIPQIDIRFEVINNVAGASGVRQFFPQNYVEGTPLGSTSQCPGIYSVIRKVYDCDSDSLTYIDEETGTEVDPADFVLVDPSLCGL